jgi:Tol biopolymer transport system component
MGSRLTAVLASTFVCLLALASSAQASFPGANGKIAFEQCVSPRGPCDIWVMNSDGSGRTNLTNNPADNAWPAWSPDGRRIAFASDRDDPNPVGCYLTNPPCNFEVYVMNADGTQLVRLTNNPGGDGNPAWSPDGNKIVFSRFSPPNCDPVTCSGGVAGLYTMNPDGSSQAPLTTSGTEPAWSPDGQRILYAHYDRFVGATTNIYSINADGTGIALVIVGGPDAEDNVEPDWAPSGAKFAFTRYVTIPSDPFQPPQEGPCFDQGSCQEIWTANADGTAQARLSASAASGATPMDTNPAWSPDGTKIAFGGGRVWTMNPDGSGRTSLGPGGDPAWQPVVGPQRSDYKNAAQFCKAERDFLGDVSFAKKYSLKGSPANAFGRCVSRNH